MRLLLGSGGFGPPERRARLAAALAEHFAGARRLLFAPFALADHGRYLDWMSASGFAGDLALDGWHAAEDPLAALERAEGVYVGGGNTFRLLAAMQARGLLEPLRRRVLAGLPYFGVSAGANLACPTIQTTNDMPIVRPAGFEALGLVPVQINAHYYAGRTFVEREDGRLEEHGGETRDERVAEYHEENPWPVLGLWEGALLASDGERIRLIAGEARLFERGRPARDLVAPAELTGLGPPPAR